MRAVDGSRRLPEARVVVVLRFLDAAHGARPQQQPGQQAGDDSDADRHTDADHLVGGLLGGGPPVHVHAEGLRVRTVRVN